MGITPFHRIRAAAAKKEKERKALEKKKTQKTELPPGAPDFYSMKLDELKEYAKENDIDIKGLSKKEDIAAKLLNEYINANENSGSENEDSGGEPPADGQGAANPASSEGADNGDGGDA